jgi:hypothetical protein
MLGNPSVATPAEPRCLRGIGEQLQNGVCRFWCRAHHNPRVADLLGKLAVLAHHARSLLPKTLGESPPEPPGHRHLQGHRARALQRVHLGRSKLGVQGGDVDVRVTDDGIDNLLQAQASPVRI